MEALKNQGLNILSVLNILTKLNNVVDMPTITLSVSSDLKHEMDSMKFINWSEVAREAIKEKIGQLKILESIANKSKLSEKDALDLGKKINESLHKKYKKKHPGAD